MKIYVEGYGCSMNLAETEAIKGHVSSNKILISDKSNADFLVINTCAVKEQTELKMLNRIKALNELAEKNNSQLIVFGCLPKVSPNLVEKISPNIIQMGPDLEKLSQVLGIREAEFSPSINAVRENPFVTIMPIGKGCTNFCTFCGTKLARGNVKSYTVEQLKEKFTSSLKENKEFWLTGQDTGAYGLDINSSLPKLLQSFLDVKDEFRLRVGMMNPHHLKRIYNELIPLFEDERIYKFLHVPVQSGSDRILKLMRRGYTVGQYKELIENLKKDIPNITIATDIIVGFPTETENEFLDTLNLVKETKPDVINMSRFGARPGTVAFDMPQLHGRDKKERSRKLTSVCRAVAFQQNKRMLGSVGNAFVSEKGTNGKFVGRTSNYKPVLLDSDLRGQFVNVEVTEIFPFYLKGRVFGN
ncbi:MAG: tRNA (N(6)-L-threonylcarbamoyladenosine(37)-C(2))-methylthiotransferase [Candidatus Diapherotrites archaeon]